ncbi:MAG: hypothetical protein JWL60_1688 [Gemmatimonadetes bacterium]|nr:hypothetical protein [Gemmatimonadota bacterium]
MRFSVSSVPLWFAPALLRCGHVTHIRRMPLRPLPCVAIACAATLAVACGGDVTPYTLYRTEQALGDTARLHVATFDAEEEEEGYNRAGCERTRELYQVQPSTLARYWCEPGRFKGR